MRSAALVVAFALASGCTALAGLGGDYSVGQPQGGADAGGQSSSASSDSGGRDPSGVGGAAGTGSATGGSAAGGASPNDPCGEPGVVVCYRFEQNVLDGSPGQHHANASNASYVPGHDGMALHHDVGSLLEPPAGPLALSPLTIELWMRPSTLPTTGRTALVDHAGIYGMFILPGGVIQCRATTLLSGSVVNANEWTHVACSFSDSEIRIYLNGVLDASAGNAPLSTSPTTIYVGSNYPSGEELVGELDEFRIFDYVRSDQQVCQAAGIGNCP